MSNQSDENNFFQSNFQYSFRTYYITFLTPKHYLSKTASYDQVHQSKAECYYYLFGSEPRKFMYIAKNHDLYVILINQNFLHFSEGNFLHFSSVKVYTFCAIEITVSRKNLKAKPFS